MTLGRTEMNSTRASTRRRGSMDGHRRSVGRDETEQALQSTRARLNGAPRTIIGGVERALSRQRPRRRSWRSSARLWSSTKPARPQLPMTKSPRHPSPRP